jgi:hypothetical protein
MWDRVLAAWDDDRIHDAVLQYAMRTGSLPDLAGRYHDLVGDPERGDRAKRRIDAIVAAMTTQLYSMKTPKPGRTPIAITLSAFGVCALLLAWLGWSLWGPR